MKIEHLKNETYRIRKMVNGTKYTVYFDHKPSQKEIMTILSEKLQNTEYGQNKGSFETYCNKYVDSKRNVLSPSTLGGYQKLIRTLSPELKSKNLYDIEQIDIQTEINNYAADHSPKSVKNLHGFISAVMGMFRPSMKISTALPQNKKKKNNLPTEDDVKRIIKASEGTPYHIPFQLAILGMRRSEICAVTPDDIDGNILTINKARIYDEHNHIITRDNTKTEESTREIYLPDELVAEIERAGVIYDKTPPMLVKTLHKYQDELGIERFRLHDLRAFFVSYAHSLGVPDVYIMKAGGWKTDHVMKSVYRNALRDKTEEMQKKISGNILQVTNLGDKK